jgi:hypothetical protein
MFTITKIITPILGASLLAHQIYKSNDLVVFLSNNTQLLASKLKILEFLKLKFQKEHYVLIIVILLNLKLIK